MHCRWDCHGLPVEHEIDKKLGKAQRLHVLACMQYHMPQLLMSNMHALAMQASADGNQLSATFSQPVLCEIMNAQLQAQACAK